jgi:hypothetical protein
MQRVSYELDPFNRLVIGGSGKKSSLNKFRKVLDGRFKLDENNNLSYHIKAPSSDDTIPHQVKISGTWSLTNNHELRFTLDKQARKTFGDAITLQGQILDIEKNSLLFAMTTKNDDGESTYILNLQGSWKADENNHLSFYVKKESGKYDILTFGLAWEMNKNHQIIYRYEKASLLKKKKEAHELTFKGYWDIKGKTRITYLLDADSQSGFEFSAGAGILAENYIKYEIGIGLKKSAEETSRLVVLSGKWKLKKDIGILFEIEYTPGDVRAMLFGSDVKLSDNDTVTFRLRNSIDNNDLKMTLKLSHRILEGAGEMFMRALASREEVACYAGMAWQW